MNDEKIKSLYKAIEKIFTSVKEVYIEVLKKEFLEHVLLSLGEEEDKKIKSLLKEIKEWKPVSAYPQKDTITYGGYTVWCNSIVFEKEKGKKAIILERDGDFCPESISIYNKNDSKFFVVEDEEFTENLMDMGIDLPLSEEVIIAYEEVSK